jgi:hypothetical protein
MVHGPQKLIFERKYILLYYTVFYGPHVALINNKCMLFSPSHYTWSMVNEMFVLKEHTFHLNTWSHCTQLNFINKRAMGLHLSMVVHTLYVTCIMREIFPFFFVIMKFRDPAHSELTESSFFNIYL